MKKIFLAISLMILCLFHAGNAWADINWSSLAAKPSSGNSYYIFNTTYNKFMKDNDPASCLDDNADNAVYWTISGTWQSSYTLTSQNSKKFSIEYKALKVNGGVEFSSSASGDNIKLSSDGTEKGPYTIYRARKFAIGNRNVTSTSEGVEITGSATQDWVFIPKATYDALKKTYYFHFDAGASNGGSATVKVGSGAAGASATANVTSVYDQGKVSVTYTANSSDADVYKFFGWAEAGSSTIVSTANPYTFDAVSTSTDIDNPTVTSYYAKFSPISAAELEANVCFDNYWQAEGHLNLATRKPSAMTSEELDSYYYNSHGTGYIDFKTTSGEIFINVGSLNAARYSLSVWEVVANSSYANIYKKGASGSETISYNSASYARVARIDMRSDVAGGRTPFFVRTKDNILLEQGEYIIGLEGGEGAAFDQIMLEATTPVFCGNAFYHLVSYDTDATSGKVEEICDIQSVLCSEASTTQVTVPAPPIAPDGYHFGGWNTRADKRGMHFDVGQQITLPTTHTNKYYVMALYADWQPDTISITLNGNGGAANGSATILYEQKQTATLTPVTGAPAEQVLVGYFNQPTGGKKVLSVNGAVSPQVTGFTDRFSRWIKAEDCTLYARFGVNHTVTFSHGEHGDLHVYDDQGNQLESGVVLPEGTVIRLQARPDANYQVHEWTGAGVVATNHNTVITLTVTKDENINVTFETGEVSVCSDTRIIQCEEMAAFVGIGGSYGGSTSGTNGQHPKQTPTTLKIGNSQQYCFGFTGSGYMDFDGVSSESEIYYKVNIPESGDYRVTVYANNGGTKNVNFYHTSTAAGTTYWVQPNGESKYYRQGLSFNSSDNEKIYLRSMSGKFSMTQTGDYLIGLNGTGYAKWDRIVITRVDGKQVFCPESNSITIDSYPWNTGAELINGDRVHLDPAGFVGCVTKVVIDVKGTIGDAFDVLCNGIKLYENKTPGTLEIPLTDDIRTYGLDIISKSSVSTLNASIYSGEPHDGFYVQGNTLYDANGIPFIMRGTNVAHCWLNDEQPTLEALEHIADFGANTVRIVLSDGEVNKDGTRWKKTPIREVSQIINKCEELGLACVLEVHDALGVDNVDKLNLAVEYWYSIKSALVGHENSVIINIANEWYGSTISGTTQGSKRDTWRDAYKSAITRLRTAGLHHCIMIDCPGWGQDAATLAQSQTTDILKSDPDKNVCFSIHMYASYTTDDNVKNAIDKAMAMNICVVVGEYGWAHEENGSTKSVKWETIINYTNERRVGALQWSYYGNSGGVDYLDLVDIDHNLKTYTNPNSGANWGPNVVNNSWKVPYAKLSTVYNVEDVMQLRSVTTVTDEQDYLVWSGATPLAVSGAQVSVGPEHFSTAVAGDKIMVYISGVGSNAKGEIFQTNTSTKMGEKVIPNTTDGDYEYILTEADITEAQANGLVLRGSNYSIEAVELHAANCHMMRVAADTIRVTTPLAIGSDYRNTFDFGNWEHTLSFRPAAFSGLSVGNILRFRITPSDGYGWDDTRVAYRCYASNAGTSIGGVSTVGDISFNHALTDLGGAVPDRQGFVDIRVTAEVLTRLKSHGLVVFGKNAKMHYFSVIGDTFVVPADSATLVPECGIDNLIIHQGGQVINQGDVTVFKKISFVRDAQGSYTYCSFDDETTKNFKGEGGTYTNEVNKWYTFTTPFPVNQIQAYDEEGYWNINPVWTNGGVNQPGFFYMESLVGEQTGQGFRTSWQKIDTISPQPRVPYIILFATDAGEFFGNYFAENPKITYTYNVPVGQTLTISGRSNAMKEVPANDVKTYYLLENNTLYDMSFEGSSAYILNTETNMFELVENAVVHPFECYVQATDHFKYEHPTLAMSRLEMFISDYNTPTSLETLNAAILLDDPDTRVYDVMGREYNVDHLPHGVFILVNHGQAIKVML